MFPHHDLNLSRTNVINKAGAVSLLNDFKGSDTTSAIEREALAPARHAIRVNSSPNSHCATAVRNGSESLDSP